MSDRNDLAAAAETLRALHHGPDLLVLPNAWDAASAHAVCEAGFAAVATTSSGIAASLGYPDQEGSPVDEMLAAVARAATVPVTADLEAGYGLTATELVDRLLAAGGVGLNLEDSDHRHHGLVDPDRHAEYLAAVKQAGRAAGVDIVLNARVDTYLRSAEPPGDPAEEADIGRTSIYWPHRTTSSCPLDPSTVTETRAAARATASASSSAVAHAVGAVSGPSGPSSRTTAWTCTTPRDQGRPSAARGRRVLCEGTWDRGLAADCQRGVPSSHEQY